VVESRRQLPLGVSIGLMAVLFAGLLGVALARTELAAASTPTNGAEIKEYVAFPSTTGAGGHPDITLRFKVSTRINPIVPGSCNCNDIKEGRVETPAGFIGNPHATPRCTAAQFTLDQCPSDSQVGVSLPAIELNDCGCEIPTPTPLYNLVPQPGQAGLLAFKAEIYDFPIYTVISARTGGDFGLDAEVRGIGQFFTLAGFEQTMWGVPASPLHDAERFKHGGTFPERGPISSNSPETPFLSSPTTCTGPLSSTFISTSYDHVVHTATAPWPEVTGCDLLSFNPSLSAGPSTTAADTPSGLDVALKVPQIESPTVPSASEIKATTVTLPEGFSVNPNAADGKTSCSDVQARFGTEEEAQCPEDAKVGTLSLLSSALPEAIPGAIYLGEPLPGNRYRVFITADGFGTHIKLPGSAYPDPKTGQLKVVFENLPQSPLTEFDMHFFGSERGLLATPTKCGTYPVRSEFVPWDSELPNQTSTQFFKIESGPGGAPCPGTSRPFAPTLHAAGASNGAGAHAPFSLTVNRPDGDQNLNTIAVKTPPGFTATLKGVPPCSDAALAHAANPAYSGLAEQAAPSCPAASQVGTASAGAGAGTHPLYVPGKVYLAGPYKGSPLSLAVITPAVSGPYDLGSVLVRVAVNVDPASAQVTAISDPLPQILEGIPLRLRSILFNLDRPNFTLNPTSCDPLAVEGLIAGTEGATTTPSNHFQVANCDSLDFDPKLTTTLTGATRRGGYPALKAVLTQSPTGEANVSRAAVSLPHSEILAQEHIGTVCTRVQFAAHSCPAASVYGKAKVITPLLDSPLEGPVYLRSSSNPLPDLVAALKGPASQPIEIDLSGRIDTVKGGIRTTFDAIPDAAVSKFTLEMKGGAKGLLVNSTDLCAARHFTEAKITGQNGKKANQNPVLAAPCGSKAARARRAARKGGAR
jgi:hypothetical protein